MARRWASHCVRETDCPAPVCCRVALTSPLHWALDIGQAELAPMAGPTLAHYLQSRQLELEAQVSRLRGELEPLEAELAQVRKVRSLIADARAAGLVDLASDAVLPPPPTPKPPETEPTIVDVPSTLLINGRIVRQTIKLMVLAGLRDHFKNAGATPSDLRDYIKSAYGKDVDRNSISPQLARLRDQGAVEQFGSEGKWRITLGGSLYDHPSSWKDLDKDEPPDQTEPNTRLGDMR